MADHEHPHFFERSAERLLSRPTEQTAIRRLARGLAGEFLLVDHEGDIVDPGIDPRVFTPMAWETLRLHQPETCAELERHGLVRDTPRSRGPKG